MTSRSFSSSLAFSSMLLAFAIGCGGNSVVGDEPANTAGQGGAAGQGGSGGQGGNTAGAGGAGQGGAAGSSGVGGAGALECGPGTKEVEKLCLPSESVTCGPGTKLDTTTKQCLPGVSTPPSTVSCGPGTKVDETGQRCVGVGPSGITCGFGTILDVASNQCLPGTAVVTCGPGTVQAPGKVCVPAETEVTCGPGSVLQGNTCVAGQEDPNKPVTCGPGTQLKEGQCVPGGGSAPDIQCGPGLEKVNNVCQLPAIALTCGPGTVEVDKVCVAAPGSGGNGVTCGPGTVLQGDKCVVGPKNPAQPITCGPGTKKEGDKCVPDGSGATITCAPPLVLEGKECVQATKVTCGEGTVQVDNVCVAAPGSGGNGIQCGPGTFLQGTVCVVGPKQDGVPLTCGPGTKKEGDKCVPDGSGATITCGPDTIQQGNACVPKPSEVTCGPGTIEVDKVCVAAPGSGGNGVTCGPDTVLQGNQCVPGPKPPAGQPLQCGPGTAEVNGVCTPNNSDGSISCGPGTVADGKTCIVEPPALECGPGTREVDRVCVPDPQNGGNDVTCGPGTVLFGVTCILGDKPDPQAPLTCGAETQPVDDTCKPTGNGGAISCGEGTKLEGKQCVPTFCGQAGNFCQGAPNADPKCEGGVCGIVCDPGFADCNNNIGDGCEVELEGNDVSNCGACGEACVSGANSSATCTGGVCGIACQAGFGNCDGEAKDGCEVNTAGSDVNNCGGCGIECAQGGKGEAAVCSAGVCGLVCPEGFADCDGNPGNGCEVVLDTDSNHCGACGKSCGGGTCEQGICGGLVLYEAYFANAAAFPQFAVDNKKAIFFTSAFDSRLMVGDLGGSVPVDLGPASTNPYYGSKVMDASGSFLFDGVDQLAIHKTSGEQIFKGTTSGGGSYLPFAVKNNKMFFAAGFSYGRGVESLDIAELQATGTVKSSQFIKDFHSVDELARHAFDDSFAYIYRDDKTVWRKPLAAPVEEQPVKIANLSGEAFLDGYSMFAEGGRVWFSLTNGDVLSIPTEGPNFTPQKENSKFLAGAPKSAIRVVGDEIYGASSLALGNNSLDPDGPNVEGKPCMISAYNVTTGKLRCASRGRASSVYGVTNMILVDDWILAAQPTFSTQTIFRNPR